MPKKDDRHWDTAIPTTIEDVVALLQRRIVVHDWWRKEIEAGNPAARASVDHGVGSAQSHATYSAQYKAAVAILAGLGGATSHPEALRSLVVSAIQQWLTGLITNLAEANAKIEALQHDLEAHFRGTSDGPEHYKLPADFKGWTCWHCGETFLTEEGARRHFGPSPKWEGPRCLKDAMRRIRELEYDAAPLQRRVEAAEAKLAEKDAEIERLKTVNVEREAAAEAADQVVGYIITTITGLFPAVQSRPDQAECEETVLNNIDWTQVRDGITMRLVGATYTESTPSHPVVLKDKARADAAEAQLARCNEEKNNLAVNMNNRLEEVAAKLAEREARLEIDHCFKLENGELVRHEIPPSERDDFPDKITALEATIDCLEDDIKRLR